MRCNLGPFLERVRGKVVGDDQTIIISRCGYQLACHLNGALQQVDIMLALYLRTRTIRLKKVCVTILNLFQLLNAQSSTKYHKEK